MAKYTDDDLYTDTVIYFTMCVANELAEANRLKRLELKHKWPSLKGHTRKELEDKA